VEEQALLQSAGGKDTQAAESLARSADSISRRDASETLPSPLPLPGVGTSGTLTPPPVAAPPSPPHQHHAAAQAAAAAVTIPPAPQPEQQRGAAESPADERQPKEDDEEDPWGV
jgi:hypothetical protein